MIAGYIRVSTLRQKEEGVSVDTQQLRITEYALRMELIKKKKKFSFM